MSKKLQVVRRRLATEKADQLYRLRRIYRGDAVAVALIDTELEQRGLLIPQQAP
ncbi:hypothetical protein [Hymenobacter sp. B81]|uniref:hypothetical protein n=1 Tax=Hymenobacter sp. B81 TaxID=3344878 RepID=UPI0037DD249D